MRPIFLVGAQKAGSSYLHHLLEQGPEVVTYPSKEPHFFSSHLHEGKPFESLFAERAGAKVWLDSSVSYLHTASAATAIYDRFGSSAAIVAILRDPVERAVSAWLHSVKHGRDMRSAHTVFGVEGAEYATLFVAETARVRKGLANGSVVYRPAVGGGVADREYNDSLLNYRYIANSFYADQLRPYDQLFHQVVVVDFPDLVRDPVGTVARLRSRLSLMDGPLNLRVGRNETRIRKIRILRNHFRNVMAEHGPLAAARRASASALPLSLRQLDPDRLRPRLSTSVWAVEARKSYEALRARKL